MTQTTDFRTTVPAGWTLSGLSAPRSDGVNEYRVPHGDRSTLQFSAPGATFAELEFQLYSPDQAVTATVLLDGREIGQKTFPADTFAANLRVGGFVHGGRHELTTIYRCQAGPCALPVSQYWTQVRITPARPETARQPAGLGVERWLLNAPDSPLTIVGAGPLVFDGVNYARAIPGQGVQLTWPQTDATTLNATMHIYAPQEIRVTTRVGQDVVSVQSGDKLRGVSPAVSLTSYPEARAVSVQVECISRGVVSSGCASLYFPQVLVLTASPPLTAGLGAGLAAVSLILVLIRLLGLAPSASARQ